MHMDFTSHFTPFLAAALLAGAFSSANACTPEPNTKPASIVSKAHNANAVFDGTVSEITDTYLKINVAQYFKGSGLEEVKIAYDKNKINSCSDQFTLNQRALFFTTGKSKNMLELVYDGAFGSSRELSGESFSQITAATECMATYEGGKLIVPCISHKDSLKVYKAMLEPTRSTGALSFTVSYAQPVTHTVAAIKDSVTVTENFDSGSEGGFPTDWKKGITGFGDINWQLIKDSTAPSAPLVLNQSADGLYPWAVKKDSSLSDGFVSVKFKPISGSVDQAAGLIWRWKDDENYYVARANALEDNVSIYYMKDGVRMTIKYEDTPSNLPVNRNQWQTLRVDFKDNHFVVSFEGTVIVDVTDSHIKGAGAVGVWTKEDSETSFDNFSYGN